MASRCRKFVPNLFNKTKCQSCFGAKESHTAEALESSKAARKISKCAYLFVSPDLDFSNPLQRTKRWQRRFFILYDDGELTYSVDDNPSTIPQGSVDMNKCTDVFHAEEKTGHEYSIGLVVPNEPTSYVKGTAKDEIQRWFDVLVMYPRSLTIKTKRSPGSKPGGGVSRHLSYYPAGTEKSVSDDEDADSVHSKDSGDTYERSGRTRGRYKQRDMRRSKSEVRPSDLRLAEDEYKKRTDVGFAPLLLSSNTAQGKFGKDKNLDGLPARRAGEPETFSSVRSMKHRKAAKSQHAAESSKAPSGLPTPTAGDAVANNLSSSGASGTDSVSPLSRRLSMSNIPTSSKLPTGHKALGRAASAAPAAGAAGGGVPALVYPPPSTPSGNPVIDANETDEHKIAKNEHARKTLEKSPIVRKGWLLVRQDIKTNVWSKHWFVLCGMSLSYYKDAKAEETNQVDGVIDVASAYEVSSVKAERNHGFRIKTKEGEYVLSAMTSGIRRNWIDAVESIIAEIRRGKEKTARQDMGFVFESPLRSPRTPTASAAAAAITQPIVAPVVPDTTSRVNATLREMAERRRETGDDKPLEEMYEVVAGNERKDSVCSDTEREVSALTSHQEGQTEAAAALTHRPTADVPLPQSPKSPSAFVSPSQRIKEKSRAKTPPRARSPPPPAAIVSTLTPAGGQPASTSSSSTPVDRVLLLPTGNSSDENDESLTAKLLESQKQVQHLQQQVQDVNSSVRKQRVEIESLQTKLELTTSQLRDMETALTQSAQNLTKERKTTSRLNEALENYKREHTQSGGFQDKSAILERQLKEATQKLAAQEVKMSTVGNLEEQLQIRTSKLATLEKVLGNTRRHLQDAVENMRETELHYQTKIEEIEHDFEEERVELQDKLHQMEERLNKVVTESNNTVNSDLSTQLMKERAQSLQRLEELVKEQKGKIDQLTEDNGTARQQIDELQCFKDRAAVNQNQLDSVQQEYNSLQAAFLSMRHDLESVANELEVKDNELISRSQENSRLSVLVEELQEKCKATHPQVSGDVYTNQQVECITQDLKAALEGSRAEIEELRQSHAQLAQRLEINNVTVQSLSEKCRKAEMELSVERNKKTPAVAPVPPPAVSSSSSSTGAYTLVQLVDLISAVTRSCERMTESAVAMLAGEMIETDIKAAINFNQQQRGLLGNSTVDQLCKKLSGVRQRLNYIVKHSVAKGQFDRLLAEKELLSQELAAVQRDGDTVTRDAPDCAGDSDYLTALLERCRAEILCISSDITRVDISHVEARLHSLNSALQQNDELKFANDFSANSAIESYCNKLAIQASAMFEIARSVTDGVDLPQILTSVENCLQATSGLVTNVEDLSLRNYALLISERLLLSYELSNLIETGQWKCFDGEHSHDFATKALVAETLQRVDMFSMSKGQPLGEAFLSCCLNNLLQRNVSGSESLVSLKNETTLVGNLVKSVDEALVRCVQGYVSLYTSELVNFGVVEMSEVESLATRLTSHLCTRIKRLACAGSLGDLTTRWLHNQLCTACEQVKGLDPKEPPIDLGDLALKVSMYEAKLNAFSSLMMKHKTCTLSQSLVSEASKLAGLSAELAKRTANPGSTEAKIAALAQRLERTDRLLSAYTSRYSDSVQQVMREVVHSMQMNLLRYQLGAGEYPLSPVEQSLTLQVSALSLQLQQASQRNDQLVNMSQHEKAVEALHDEMSLLKVEHSTELDESKRDMKMVLKSVKAQEYRLATELTQQISSLKSQLADEQRAHQAVQQKLEDSIPGTVPLEEHVQLKDKVRDLENCLHEMQEEFEEELYQERRAHLAELDKLRAELLEVINKCDSHQLTADGVHSKYNAVIDKLKAEQASLQQWIDDMREAHRDEIDALQHERDAALADEVMTAQSALEAAQSSHAIEMQQMRSKMEELEQKAARLLEVERDLLLYKRESDNKEERINTLDSKLMSLNKKVAKLELNASKSHQAINDLTTFNKELTERNSQLVGKFTQEIGKIGSKLSPPADGLHTALKAQVDSLTEKLTLEQLTRSRLEDKMEELKDNYEQRLQQSTDDAKLDVAVSVSPAEEMVLRRQIDKARSPSPHVRRCSPTPLAASSTCSPLSGSNNNTDEHALADSKPSAIGSPRRLADKSYDINRSKSTTSLGKQPKMSRSKRLSNPIMLDTNDRGFQQYQKSGGMSIADRMRKFK